MICDSSRHMDRFGALRRPSSLASGRVEWRFTSIRLKECEFVWSVPYPRYHSTVPVSLRGCAAESLAERRSVMPVIGQWIASSGSFQVMARSEAGA